MSAELDLVHWLLAEGRFLPDDRSVIEGFGTRLVAAGIPVDRLTVGIPILHPQMVSTVCVWNRGAPAVLRQIPLTATDMERLANSPMLSAYRDGRFFRHRLMADTRDPYPIVAELRGEGFTDYAVQPFRFSDAGLTPYGHKAVTVATRDPGGFREADLALVTRLTVPLAATLEVLTLKRTAATLLDTYVGPVAGQRVLAGRIHRGDIETIRAVIWFSDLRGFTALSERLGAATTIALVNEYFGHATAAIANGGGEVLKFIGDAVLAIFPLGDDPPAAARRAVTAARECLRALADRAGEPLAIGIGLHAGEVLYGNVGGPNRLDFTVMGPAVNLASRIEGLTGQHGQPLLLSADLAALLGDAAEPVGEFALKGVLAPQSVYRPRD